jgi:hypothetical protein
MQENSMKHHSITEARAKKNYESSVIFEPIPKQIDLKQCACLSVKVISNAIDLKLNFFTIECAKVKKFSFFILHMHTVQNNIF